MFVNSNQILIMASVIIASLIMASGTIMANVIYGKCYLWQMYYGKCNYGKSIYGKSIMANETEPFQLLVVGKKSTDLLRENILMVVCLVYLFTL